MSPFVFFLWVGMVLVIAIVAETELHARRWQKARVWQRRRSVPLTAAFRAWAESEINDAALRAWLTTRTQPQLRALTRRLERFTHQLDFELRWLVEGDLAREPELYAAARSIVLDYCRAAAKLVSD